MGFDDGGMLEAAGVDRVSYSQLATEIIDSEIPITRICKVSRFISKHKYQSKSPLWAEASDAVTSSDNGFMTS